MHPKNKYAQRKPDFAALAKKYPAFAAHVKAGRVVNFNDAAALRSLTATLLKEDFDLDVELRDDRLCPTVTNRLDYALLCLDLAAYASGPHRALDIGTGHVAIYALLLHRLRPDAHIVGTELDGDSRAHAQKTVDANGASEAVTIEAPPDGERLLPLSPPGEEETENSMPNQEYTFCMCNPPFYGSAEEVAASRELKADAAPAAPTAATVEEITAGGEQAFVGRLIAESARLRTRVAWYTSLLGMYGSVHALVPRLRALTNNYYVVNLRQAKTVRWVLIWSFGPHRLPDSLTRPEELDTSTGFARLLPPPTTWSLTPQPARPQGELATMVLKVLKEAQLWPPAGDAGSDEAASAKTDDDGVKTISDEQEPGYIYIAPMANTWSRSARRAAQRDGGSDKGGADSDGGGENDANGHDELNDNEQPTALETADPPEPLFRARLAITGGATGSVRLEWTWGRDRDVVDGFWKFLLSKTGLLKRRPTSGPFGSRARGRGGARGGTPTRGGGRGGRGGRGAFTAPPQDFGWGQRAQRGRADREGHWRGGGPAS